MTRVILWALLTVQVVFFGSVSASAQGSAEFYQRSNIKDALIEGDCQRFGGKDFRGDVSAMANALATDGQRVDGYKNVLRYRGKVYVLWTFRSGFVERTMKFCIFG